MARKKALNKDIRVEIKKSLGRYISIFLIKFIDAPLEQWYQDFVQRKVICVIQEMRFQTQAT